MGNLKLISEHGHWALYDNSMIFGPIVWLVEESDVHIYHLIDDKGNELYRPKAEDIVRD